MNPIILAALNLLSKTTRVCPQCKKQQPVPANKSDEKVRCESCGADIPPRK